MSYPTSWVPAFNVLLASPARLPVTRFFVCKFHESGLCLTKDPPTWKEMKIKSPFRNMSRSSGSEKGPQFEELSDSDRCSDVWKVIRITRGPGILDGWQKCLPRTCCQHPSTTGPASPRGKHCPHLHFGVLESSIIWAGSLSVLPAGNNNLQLGSIAGKTLGFRKSSSGVFIFPGGVMLYLS